MLVLNTPDKTKVLTLETSRPFPVVVAVPTDAVNLPYALANIAALRAAPTPGVADVIREVLGYNTAGDANLPHYRWAPTSTAADNGGTVIRPTSILAANPGRWISIANPAALDARIFGVFGDNVDATSKIVAAIEWILAQGGGKLLLPQGTIRCNTGFSHPGRVSIFGSTMGDGTIINHTGDDAWLRLDIARCRIISDNFTVSDLTIQGNAGGNARGISIDSLSNCRFENLHILGYSNGYGLDLYNGRAWTENTHIRNCIIRDCYRGLVFRVRNGDPVLNNNGTGAGAATSVGTDSFCGTQIDNLVVVVPALGFGVWFKGGLMTNGTTTKWCWPYMSTMFVKGNLISPTPGQNCYGVVFEKTRADNCLYNFGFEGEKSYEYAALITKDSRITGRGYISGWEGANGQNGQPNFISYISGQDTPYRIAIDTNGAISKNTGKYIYCGSLPTENDASNVSVAKIRVWGGNLTGQYYANPTGVGYVDYLVHSRGGIKVFADRTQAPYGEHQLRIFQNGTYLDIVVDTLGTVDYDSFVVESWIDNDKVLPVLEYSSSGKTDITSNIGIVWNLRTGGLFLPNGAANSAFEVALGHGTWDLSARFDSANIACSATAILHCFGNAHSSDQFGNITAVLTNLQTANYGSVGNLTFEQYGGAAIGQSIFLTDAGGRVRVVASNTSGQDAIINWSARRRLI